MQAFLAGLLAQRCQCSVMAGVQREHMGTLVKSGGKGAFDVAAQRFNLRRQPRLRLALGPEQLFTEFRQPRPLALVPDDERTAQGLLVVFECAQTPR